MCNKTTTLYTFRVELLTFIGATTGSGADESINMDLFKIFTVINYFLTDQLRNLNIRTINFKVNFGCFTLYKIALI